MYGALEDPGRPLSAEIQKLTGLSDELLAGHRIGWDYVRALMQRASVVVAHNADFDRGFIEKRSELEGISCHWACSMKHIDWEAKGFRTRALNYLAADHGFVNSFAYRALFDCATTFRLITPYVKELVQRSYLREVRILAVGAPFELKDALRNARYRWDNVKRVWFKDILEDGLDHEREFLQNEVYQKSRDTHEEQWLDAQK
jgi:DNA polymerase-3 subunit epsilon